MISAGSIWRSNANAVKAWRFRFTLDCKPSMFALGEYASLTLSEARERSETARKLVMLGINPAQRRLLDRIRQAGEAQNTFEVVANPVWPVTL